MKSLTLLIAFIVFSLMFFFLFGGKSYIENQKIINNACDENNLYPCSYQTVNCFSNCRDLGGGSVTDISSSKVRDISGLSIFVTFLIKSKVG